MKRRNKQLLVENEYVKELLAVLKENPSPSGKDFAEMIAHVGELENRLAEAVEELKTMRQELQQVQNRSLKAVLQKSCKSLENNISNMRQKLAELKDHIKRNIIDYVGGMGMDYMTLKEASEKWGISSRQIDYYCVGSRIPGAVKMAGVWLVPKDAKKPADKRRKSGDDYEQR